MKISFIKNNINVTFSFCPNDCIIFNYSCYRSKIPGKLESVISFFAVARYFQITLPRKKKKSCSRCFWETVIMNIENLPQWLKILLSGFKKQNYKQHF